MSTASAIPVEESSSSSMEEQEVTAIVVEETGVQDSNLEEAGPKSDASEQETADMASSGTETEVMDTNAPEAIESAEEVMDATDEHETGAGDPTKEESGTPSPVKKRRGRPPGKKDVIDDAPSTRGRRGKRKLETPEKNETKTPTTIKRFRTKKTKLEVGDFITWEAGSRVLTCGEGDQLGHPGRTTTKKPRKVDVVEDNGLKIVQVVGGGVHSAILTEDGVVYMSGINEKGTVPAEGVEVEGSTDEFKKISFSEEIKSQGKIVMLAAGASFTAALTDLGSVIAWGNLRDASGKIDVHQQLTAMQERPIIIVKHKKGCVVVKIVAGDNHLVMLTEDGSALTFGDCSMGQLGRTARVDKIRSQYMAADSVSSLHVVLTHKRKKISCKNVFAGGFWSAFLGQNDELFVCGLNNYSQLGVPLAELDDMEETKNDAGANEENKDLRIKTPTLSQELSGHNWTHMEGVQHIIAVNDKGEVYAIGKNTDNALGLGSWTGNDDSEHWRYGTLQKVDFNGKPVLGATVTLGSSIAWTDDGAYSWGYDTSGQLGLGLKDDDEKMISKPEKISSAHLDGFKIVQVSIADNHSIFLAAQ